MGLTYAAATRTVTTRPWTSGVTEADAIYSRLERRESGRRGLLGWRFLQAPCRGTACTFDLVRLLGSYTCQDDAHVTPPHTDICVLPFLPPTRD